MEKYCNVEFLKERQNWRGWTVGDLVCQYQYDADRVDDIKLIGCPAISFQRPSDCPEQEWLDDHILFHTERMKSIIAEIERRDHVVNKHIELNNQPLILTIKERITIDEVLSWYTEVIVEKNTWKYRCTLHGPDNHPSGVIYRDENRCWCFTCNQGGDVIDVVRLFGRIELKDAIGKLARHLGLDTKPIVQRKGGISLNVNREA